MPQANNSNEIPRLSATEDGLHLEHTILSLDSYKTAELSFLSAASESIKKVTPKVISTEETLKILEIFKNKPNVLVCQYNRPFSIGQLKMELLPSGHSLGAASLFVETKSGTLLYAPKVLTQKVGIHRQLQLKQAQVLVLGAHSPGNFSTNSGKSRQKDKDAIINAAMDLVQNKVWPTIVCNPIPTAQELTKCLSDKSLPVAVHNQIYKINKVFESYGSVLGNYSQFSPRYSKSKVIIIPHKLFNRYRMAPERPTIFVKNNDTEPSVLHGRRPHNDKVFCLNPASYGTDYQEILLKVKPQIVYFFGPYAKEYEQHFKKSSSIMVKSLFQNSQPPLF